jgi:hypothetical protein
LVLNDDGEVESVVSPDAFDPYAEFGLTFEVLEEGVDVFMMLEIEDYGGNTDFVVNSGTL